MMVVLGGCAAPASCQALPQTSTAEPEVVVVAVIWPGQDLSRARFYVFADAEMKDRVDVFPAGGPSGAGVMVLRPGKYYLMAVVDVNGNDKPDAGDSFGFYGVQDCSAQTHPQPFTVGPDQPHSVSVRILMTMDEGGRLRPVPPGPQQPGSVVGIVVGAGDNQAVVLLLQVDEGPEPLACVVRSEGSFELRAAPGRYRLIVVADADESGSVTDQDLVGWKGQENPQQPDEVTVLPGEVVNAGEIILSAKELPIKPAELPAVLVGHVPGAGLAVGANTTLSLHRDQHLKTLARTVAVGGDGRFCAALAPGTYYAKVTVDFEADGALTAGDMLGFFGVSDIRGGDKPQPLQLAAADLRDLVISLTAQLDDSGRLLALTVENEPANDAQQDKQANDDES